MENLLSARARGARSSVIRDLLKLVERPGILSLAGGLPAPESFPVARMREAIDRVLRESEAIASPLQYGPTEGINALREYVAASAEPRASAANVVITTGSQQGLDLLAHALCDPGDTVVVEHPAYLGALQAFAAADATIVAAPSDRDGLDVGELARRLGTGTVRPKACYVAPNFQNPTGSTMPVERRRQLAELADRYGFVVIEDDPYRDLRFSGEALPSIRSFGEMVVTLSSASKVLAPGLRLGWMTAPSWIVPAVVRIKQARDLHTSTLSQWLACDVLADEAFMVGHRAAIAALYAERASALVESLQRRLGDRVDVALPAGGMFAWARFADVDTTALLPRAVERGVAFVPGGAFYIDGGGGHEARLSFATLRPAQLDDAVGRLCAAIDDPIDDPIEEPTAGATAEASERGRLQE